MGSVCDQMQIALDGERLEVQALKREVASLSVVLVFYI